MRPVLLEIPGKPFGKQRPRFGNGRTYTPKETVSFERTVAVLAQPLFAQPFSGPVAIEIIATFEPPASWSRKRRESAIGTPHIQRPDFDNIQKAICDALNRIAYEDDGQIASAHCVKRWGERAGTTVIIRGLTDVQI